MTAEQIYKHNIVEKITSHIKDEKEGLLYFIADETTAFPGYGNLIDKEICNKYGINIVELPNEGGIIVSGVGSISVGYFSKDLKNMFNKGLTQNIINYLKSHGLDAKLEENDILIDGIYKVASSGTRRFGDILFSTFHISYKVDIGLINEICTKPMIKIPKGLSEYGFTHQEIKNIFEEYCKSISK